MDDPSKHIHTTQQGKKCKKCLAKGGPCHLHCGPTPKTVKRTTPKRSSPKKSPAKRTTPKRSSPKNDIAWMDVLPIPALYQTLLATKPESLNAICRTSKRASEICKSKMFQEEYLRIHTFKKKLIKGDLKDTYAIDDDISDYWGMQTVYKDKEGNVLIIATFVPTLRDRRSPDLILRVDYIPVADPNNKIVLYKGRDSWKFEIQRKTDGSFFDAIKLEDPKKIQAFLNKIDRPEWINFKENPEKIALEFIDDVRDSIKKTGKRFE